ncbi:hypothetical protein INT45_011072 [Circinella minor]|uniref:Uncharacterized protein n=1 Tax=Circinella minor TaxID=1195481 RepID=A0A8H7SER7_9FUNG|nr:hypothetical protein INT45_011072 [Circinella minor]
MNKKLYDDLCTALKSNIQRKEFSEIFDEELKQVDNVLNSSESNMLKAGSRNITRCSTIGTGRTDRLDFLSDILISVIRDIYQAGVDLSHSETIMNELVTWPSLKFALYAISGDTQRLTFFPGEEQLLSMTKQLKNNNTQYDERLCYKSDAVLRCLDKKTRGGNMELVLLETSNSYDDTTKKKVNFDFHKGMFGTVAMLKTIADRYNYASFDSFKKLKLYFIHAHTKHLRLWSISCPVPNLFVINREDKCSIPKKKKRHKTAYEFDDDTTAEYISIVDAQKICVTSFKKENIYYEIAVREGDLHSCT